MKAALFAFSFVVVGCRDPTPLHIAVVEGNTAPYAAKLAAEDINASGGIGGRLLEVDIVAERDDVTPQQAINTADSLARDARVLAVVGHGGSATSLAASQVYNANGVPQIAPSSSTPLYTNAGPYSFRMVASDEHQAEFIADHVASQGRFRRVAIVYINDDYGRALNEFVERSLRGHNLEPVADLPFLAGSGFAASADGLVKSVVEQRPDLVVWIGLVPELRVFRPLMRRASAGVPVLGSDGVSFLAASADVAEFVGDMLVAYSDVYADRPRLRNLARRFRPYGGEHLTDAAALTYDAIGVFAEAMRAGARTRNEIQTYLREGARVGRSYDGVTGTIVFDERGDARPSYVLMQVHADGTRVVH